MTTPVTPESGAIPTRTGNQEHDQDTDTGTDAGGDATADTGTTDTDGQGPQSGNKEALLRDLRKARDQRDTARTEADTVKAQLVALQWQIVDAAVTELGYKPAALHAAGVALEGLVGDDGTIDREAVTEVMKALEYELGLTRSEPQRPRPNPNANRKTGAPGGGWDQLVKGKD